MSTGKTQRIHSLDSLRAIMMLLGVVLHSALTYNVTQHGDVWAIKDPNSTSVATDFLVLIIHLFRMPIFFLIAGFFGALLFYERSAFAMIKNRVSRIVFPFVVFLFVLTPLNYFAFHYSNAVLTGIENPLNTALDALSNWNAFVPKTTSHLWFLHYLIWITLVTVLLAFVMKKATEFSKKIRLGFEWILKRPFIRLLFFSSCTFLLLFLLGTSMVDASVSLIPEPVTFFFYIFFYLTGWVLFKVKHLLKEMVKYDWICFVLAVLLTIVQGVLIQYSDLGLVPNSDSIILIGFNSVIIWLFVFSITGLFIRYGSAYSQRMRYISDSSYWVYLIHLPITAIVPSFVWKLPFPAIFKFILVVLITSFICLSTYHLFVRNTFIGKFLNGRKYPLKKSS